jgi:hypothetical protein
MYHKKHDEQKAYIKQVCDWLTLADDNILMALLKHAFEEECLEYMGYYSRYLNKELFLFALHNNNDVFM